MQAILRMLQGDNASQYSSSPQVAQIELSPLGVLPSPREKPNFDDIVSTSNDTSQTLAHLSTLYGFLYLLMHLVVRRCAYPKEEVESIRVPLRVGALFSIKVMLGRLPRDLFPQGSYLTDSLDGEIGTGGGSLPIEHPTGREIGLGARFAALGAAERHVNVSGYGGSESRDVGSLTLEPGPSISTVSIVDLINRFLIPKKPLEKRAPRLVPDPPHVAVVSTGGKKLQDAEAEYASNVYLRNGVAPGDMIALGALKTLTKAAQTQDATPFRVEEGTERFQRLLTRAQEVLDRHLFPEYNEAEFKDPDEILAKDHFGMGNGRW